MSNSATILMASLRYAHRLLARVHDFLRGRGGDLRAVEHPPGSWLQQIDSIPGVSDAGRQALAQLAVVLKGFYQTASPWTVLASLLLDRTRLAARLGTSEDLADRTRGIAIWQFLNFVRVEPAGRGLPITRLLDRVRRLVRLGDDRDLRQLPAAAQHLDAVRLMTIHGAKGLEFGGVHIPGLNSDTIPRTPPAPSCPTPEGMIAGAEDSALEVFRAGQAEEQECLFYVAQSRARDRLILYAPTEKSNGHNRPLSPFLDRLGTALTRRSVLPARALPVAAEAHPRQPRASGAASWIGFPADHSDKVDGDGPSILTEVI